MKRTRIKPRKQARTQVAEKSREDFKHSVPPHCMGCGRAYIDYKGLSVHEMLAGSWRLQCAMEWAGLLLLGEFCGCHKRLQYAPLVEQMAAKKQYDLWFYEPWKVYLMKHPKSTLAEYVEFLGEIAAAIERTGQ